MNEEQTEAAVRIITSKFGKHWSTLDWSPFDGCEWRSIQAFCRWALEEGWMRDPADYTITRDGVDDASE